MISQLYILSLRGDVILKRDFTWDVDKSSNEYFFRRFRTSDSSLAPIFSVQDTTFIHTTHNSLIFMCTTKDNMAPSFCVDFLYLIIKLIKDFCGTLTEDIIRKNFLLIYEIIDEAIDFGLVQSSTPDLIQNFLVNDLIYLQDLEPSSGLFQKSQSPIVSDKPLKLAKEKEEVFIDVIEKVTALFNFNGFLNSGYIDGCIKLKSFLKGKPELEIGISSYVDRLIQENTELKDFNFHSKVDFSRFCQDKVLTVDPPSGEIVLMNYRLTQNVDTPFKVFPYIEKLNSYKYEILVKVKSMYSNKIKANNVEVCFNLPKFTTSANFEMMKKTLGQSFEFDEKMKKAVWKILEFKGSKEIVFKVLVCLDSALLEKPVLKQISMKFDISGYTTTGMSIKYLKNLGGGNNEPAKWIRYSTSSSSYVCRVNS